MPGANVHLASSASKRRSFAAFFCRFLSARVTKLFDVRPCPLSLSLSLPRSSSSRELVELQRELPLLVPIYSRPYDTHYTHALEEAEDSLPIFRSASLRACVTYGHTRGGAVSAYLRPYATHAFKEAEDACRSSARSCDFETCRSVPLMLSSSLSASAVDWSLRCLVSICAFVQVKQGHWVLTCRLVVSSELDQRASSQVLRPRDAEQWFRV
jgi:hypothetical protein